MTVSETAESEEAFPEAYADDDAWEIEQRGTRGRSRLTLLLLAASLATAAFVGGIAAQKHWGSGSGGRATPSFPAGFAGLNAATGAVGAGQFAAQGTRGQVSYVRGNTLYVTTAQGDTVEVSVPPGLKVARTVSSSVRSVRPGETVSIAGETRSDGSIAATSVTLGASSTNR